MDRVHAAVDHGDAHSTARQTFEAHADSTLTPLAQYLAEHGKRVSDDDLGKRLALVQARVRDLMLVVLKEASDLLTSTQKERLPEFLRDALAAGSQG